MVPAVAGISFAPFRNEIPFSSARREKRAENKNHVFRAKRSQVSELILFPSATALYVVLR